MKITEMAGTGLVVVLLAVVALPASGQADWPTYGYDLEGTRFSPVDQID